MPRINTNYNTRYHEEAKKKIIAAGLELAREKGWDAVTLDAIARAVGVTKPALYSYFQNREALLREVVLAMFRNITAETEAAFARDRDIRRIIRRLADVLYERPIPQAKDCRRLPVDLSEPPAFDDEFVAIFDSYQQIIRSGLARLQSDGELSREVDPETATCAIMAMSMGLRLSSHLLGRDAEAIRQIWIETVEKILLIGPAAQG